MAAPARTGLRVGRGPPETRLQPGMAAPLSGIDRLQSVDYVLGATLVAAARPLARDIEVGAEPALEVDRFEYAVAGGEVDGAVAEIEDVVGDLAGDVAGVLVIEQHQARFVLVERFGDVAV